MYRQITLTALLASAAGRPIGEAERALAYNDVAAAWHDYLQHDNPGRGFVLIGHSQGSHVLTEIIKNETRRRLRESRCLLAGGACVPRRGSGARCFARTAPPEPIDTFFVELPGLLTAAYVFDARGSYLAVTLHPRSGAVRKNDIPGDIIVRGKVQKDWGLHLIDVGLTLGNLASVVGDESNAYLTGSR